MQVVSHSFNVLNRNIHSTHAIAAICMAVVLPTTFTACTDMAEQLEVLP